MLKNPATKYRPFPQIALADRTWPNKTITREPAQAAGAIPER